ncbi:PSTK-1 protein, partial [Aphelenchoides avenae]
MAIVLIMGIPGAGKSTAARLLCDALREQTTAPGGPSTVLQHSFDDALSEFDPQLAESARANRRRWQQRVDADLATLPSTSNAKRYVIVDDIFYLASMRRPFR